MDASIPKTDKKRVVVIGGGFAGINLVEKLDSELFQIVMVDQNNYHQFQPLLYQVASSGLEPASICFPLRRLFRDKKDFHFRLAKVTAIESDYNRINTTMGYISYDYLVIAAGATTNFYGNKNIEKVALPMKSVEEALYLRNHILEGFEEAMTRPEVSRQDYVNVVVGGGGATGVEVSGVLSELRKYALPKNYKEWDGMKINIYLVAGSKVLGSMSERSTKDACRDLAKMGVEIIFKRIKDYADGAVILDDGTSIRTRTLVWVGGVVGVTIDGIPEESIGAGHRIICDEYMRVNGMNNVYAAGDLAITSEPKYPKGHPQVAQVAIQQARLIAKNLNRMVRGEELKPFRYFNMGSMATIGRNKAVADIAGMHFRGFVAWVMWMTIHLRPILGVRNRLLILFDWVINYFHYVGSLRMILFKGKR